MLLEDKISFCQNLKKNSVKMFVFLTILCSKFVGYINVNYDEHKLLLHYCASFWNLSQSCWAIKGPHTKANERNRMAISRYNFQITKLMNQFTNCSITIEQIQIKINFHGKCWDFSFFLGYWAVISQRNFYSNFRLLGWYNQIKQQATVLFICFNRSSNEFNLFVLFTPIQHWNTRNSINFDELFCCLIFWVDDELYFTVDRAS